MEPTIVMGTPSPVPEIVSGILKRFYYVERELTRTLGGYLFSACNWELKKLLPLHIWQDSLRANELRARVLEMRFPRRDVDQNHDERLATYMQTLIRCRTDEELIQGVYFVTKRFLLDAYENYLKNADPLGDAPTIALMERFPSQLRKQIFQMKSLCQIEFGKFELPLTLWQIELSDYLFPLKPAFDPNPEQADADFASACSKLPDREAYIPPRVPARDPRFVQGALYHLPPIYGDTDDFTTNQVLQGIACVNDIWASEITGLVLWLWDDMPWEFYLDMARWCYDKSRHCQMGEQRLKAWGFQTGIDFPVYPDHISSQDCFMDAFVLLHAVETNGPAWKSNRKQKLEANGNTASSQDFNYDWADESIHFIYGYKWALHRLGGDEEKLAKEKARTRDKFYQNYEQLKQQWDYEPFMSNILHKIAEIKNSKAR